MTEIESKHAIVARPPYELYMAFTDMRNFLRFVPEDRKEGITADYDTLKANVQGFDVGIKVDSRIPYSQISFKDDGAPFAFTVDMHFDANPENPSSTNFHVGVSADLNFMMKMLLGSKIKEGLDKMVDALTDISSGKMPEGMDASMFERGGMDTSVFHGGGDSR